MSIRHFNHLALLTLMMSGLLLGSRSHAVEDVDSPPTSTIPFTTEVVRGQQPAVHVVINISGLEDLWLVATSGPDNYLWDQAIWANPRLHAADGSCTDLTTLRPTSTTVGWGSLFINRDHVGKPLRIADGTFERGFWAHAPSALKFHLGGKYERFEAWVGIGNAAGPHGTVRFKVLKKFNLPKTGPSPRSTAPPVDAVALRLAIKDLMETFPRRYPRGKEFLRRLQELCVHGDDNIPEGALRALQREAMLANPLLDFEELLVLRRNFGSKARRVISTSLGMPSLNAHTNDTIRKSGWDNEIAALRIRGDEGTIRTIHRSAGGEPITDLELHFDGARIMFSSIGGQNNWRLFEVRADGTGLRQLTPDDGADIGHFDSCYLPDGRIIFDSTATYLGLPCENGGRAMAALYLLDPRTMSIRQLAFEQDSDWCPTVMNDGRVMYLRWEYADLPHSNSRILMSMNPDGTDQRELYGSNSYFPNAFYFARPVPDTGKVVGIISGHHGISRSGRMLILDPAVGNHEADGVVQEIPGRGKKVEPIIRDRLIDGVWPQFLHPYPLGDKYYLVSMKSNATALWGIYLVDVFDNMTLIVEIDGAALLDPIPLRKTTPPPIIPDRVDLSSKESTVLLVDVYSGPGLRGIPRGTVKNLRVFAYYFSPRGTGGLLGTIGMDGPWDIKRVLGTVPVEEDGSAHFTVPANTPISVQPLDDEGKALQLMRSWFVGMPGEAVTCVGCHDRNTYAPPVRDTLAARRAPSRITPWYGPARGFSFMREVQPVLDRACVGCHDGSEDNNKSNIPDLRGTVMITDWSSKIAGHAGTSYGGKFSVSYAELHRFVRRPGIESDLHLLTPMDFHADTTELVQMLQKGHHGVELDDEQWDRLVTWVDLNAPFHGNRGDIPGCEHLAKAIARGQELSKRYAGIEIDYEAMPLLQEKNIDPVIPKQAPPHDDLEVSAPGWPLDSKAARRKQGIDARMTLDLGAGITLELTRIPGGEFVIGGRSTQADEHPRTAVTVKTFWLGTFEVTNEQYALFDPAHDSRHESRHGYQFGRLGYPLNEPRQPVVRASWKRAMEFCAWLGDRTGHRITLPTEAQWEYACRAGTETPFYYGDLDEDFAPHANLGDARLREFAACTARANYTRAEVISNPSRYDDWIPKDDRFDDGGLVSMTVGKYRPNPWGLHDMHGNVQEWTRSLYHAYPYVENDGRNKLSEAGKRVARGGSWYDRPQRCRSAHRTAYHPFQRVFNVGFRVVIGE